MRLVLDSNEYIKGFGPEETHPAAHLLGRISLEGKRLRLHVTRRIEKEVARNLTETQMRLCHRFWRALGVEIDEESVIPGDVLAKYAERGLKIGDALIAAYAESKEVDILVSENRHFLALSGPLPFKVLNAGDVLKIIARPT